MKCLILFLCLVAAPLGIFAEPARPNIIWMVSEDNGARWLGCYGNPAQPTPTLDKLAEEGFRYTHCYASVPVCAPQRFTWITGINAISAGTQGMRSGVKIPESIRFYPEIFKELGYYTSKGDDAKTDYNHHTRRRPDANGTWSDNKTINWENLKQNQPFFHVFNTHDTHEWQSFGGFNPKRDKAPRAGNLAKYHPDIPEMHFVYEKYNQAHRNMDQRVKGWLEDLEKSGMAEDTIVIYSSDHGGVLPRSKRFLYNSGTHCPLIVRIPEKFKHLYPAAKPGETVDELVSFTDFPKTWLSLAGATEQQVTQMQGRIFMGAGKEDESGFIYSFRNRMDDRLDMVRSVRDDQFLYMRNYYPFSPVGQYLSYMYNSESMRSWNQYRLDGKTDAITGRFFESPRAINELYLYESDYDNVINLADDEKYGSVIKNMCAALRAWQLRIFDSGFLPEDEIGRLAEKSGMTVYDYVRNSELYPLEQYMDMADLSLEKSPENIPVFLEALSNRYLGNRYWATLGILNLTFDGDSANMPDVVAAMKERLGDESEAHVLKAHAAWVLIRAGEPETGLAFLKKQSLNTYSFRTIINILDWMDTEIAMPAILDFYMSAKFERDAQRKCMVKKLVEHSPAEFAALITERENMQDRVNHHTGRLKKFAKGEHKFTPETFEKEKAKSERELAESIAELDVLTTRIIKTNPYENGEGL